MFPFTLQQLEILKTIAVEQSFTKAASMLHLSQPTLTKHIKKLEKNLGLLLINRERKQIFLTQDAKIFLQYSNRILELSNKSCEIIVDLKNCDRRNLIIGTNPIIDTYLMPHILALFIQNYPQIKLNIEVNSTRIIAKKIITQKIDIAVVNDKISNNLKENFTIKPFVYDELNLVIANYHTFTNRKTINKKDLDRLNFITLNSNSPIQKFIDNTLIKNKIETKQLKTILQLNSLEAIKKAVSLGLGAAFLLSSAIEKEIKLKTIEIIKIETIQMERKFFLISNLNGSKSKAFKFFYNELTRLKTTAVN